MLPCDKCNSHEEYAFMEGRSIMDNDLTAIEVIHALKRMTRKRKGDLAWNIDVRDIYELW